MLWLWSRRKAIRSLLATPAGLVAETPLAALAAASAPGLASYRLQNLADAASPTESFHTFGMAFVAGDVPRGFRPALLTEDGMRLPVQADLCARWPDGSLRWADIALRCDSIPAGGERRLVIAAMPQEEADAPPADPAAILKRSDLALDLAGLAD